MHLPFGTRRLGPWASAALVLGIALAATLVAGSTARATTVSIKPVCGSVALGHARCFSLVKGHGAPLVTTPTGYGPADLQLAYKLPSATAGAGQTVAIVDAFDDPTAESDLAQYRSAYGLPPCTTANGCFRKVSQTGGTIYPAPSPDWALEISLDLDMVSAVCPNCHILLVEATTNLNTDLYAAVDEAAALGANAISNSWGGRRVAAARRLPTRTSTIRAWRSRRARATTGTASRIRPRRGYLTAVGGTSLTRGGGTRGWTETRVERRRQRL